MQRIENDPRHLLHLSMSDMMLFQSCIMGDNSPLSDSYLIEFPTPAPKIPKPKLKDIQSMSTNLDVQLAKANSRKSKGYANPIKMCVSLSKRRFMEDGYNLDLAYITPNIVAMAYPAGGLEGYYRNSLDSVKQFFRDRHDDKYKVFNLCIESARDYPKDTFKNYSYIPFFDHNSPSIQDINNFCEDASKFLAADPKNIVAVHCKAGKSRTGVMVCCLLLYLGIFDEAQVALEYYNLRRTKDGVGVNIPSQVRYIQYWGKFLREGLGLGGLDQRLWVLKKIAMGTVGWAGGGASNLNLSIEKDPHQMLSIFDTAVCGIFGLTSLSVSKHDGQLEINFDRGLFPVTLSGDIKIEVRNGKYKGDGVLGTGWVNLNFLEVQESSDPSFPAQGRIRLEKSELDEGCKDLAKNKVTGKGFFLEFTFTSSLTGQN